MQRPPQRGPIARLLRKRAIVTKAQAELEHAFRSTHWRAPLIAHWKDTEPTYCCRICAADVECGEHICVSHS